MDQIGKVHPIDRAGFYRAAVDHDAGGRTPSVRVEPGLEQSAQRHCSTGCLVGHHIGVEPWVGSERHHRNVFDGELDPLELTRPALLEVFHGVQDQIVEALPAGLPDRNADVLAADRHRRGDKCPAQATTVPITVPSRRRSGWDGAIPRRVR